MPDYFVVAEGGVVRKRLKPKVAEPEAPVALGAVLKTGLHRVSQRGRRDAVYRVVFGRRAGDWPEGR